MEDNQEKWEELYNLLVDAYCSDETGLIENDPRFKPTNLEKRNLEELEDLHIEYKSALDGLNTFNKLFFEEGYDHLWDD